MEESQGTVDQARSQAQEMAGQVTDKVREGASEAKEKAGEQVRQQVDNRSAQAGEQARAIGGAMRRTSSQLRDERQELPAKVLDAVADRAERLGSYLEQSGSDDLVGQVEDFARRQPLAIAAGGFVVGLVASRLLKASSASRYQRRSDASFAPYPRTDEPEWVTPRTQYIPPTSPVIDVPPASATAREGF